MNGRPRKPSRLTGRRSSTPSTRSPRSPRRRARASRQGLALAGSVKLQNADVQHRSLVQGGPQRPVQAVLQVQLTPPPDHVREQVAVERRVRVQDGVQIEHVLRGDELVKADGARRYLGPFTRAPCVIGVGPSLAYLLEDHTCRV